MIKKSSVGIVMASSLLVANSFVYFPVFAVNPVDINIVELVDEGGGSYKAWEDITDAMPGITYSAIPRVMNNGTVPVSVRMCLSESAIDGNGAATTLPPNTFQIEILPHWTLESSSSDATDPASGNCYNYDSLVEVGGMTEPLFDEVTLTSELGNEYKNSTFKLHIEADAMGDEEEEEDDDGGDDDVIPSGPDTGANTETQTFIKYTGITFVSAGLLVSIVALIIKLRSRK